MDSEKRFEQLVTDLNLNAEQTEQFRALENEYRQRRENDRNSAGEGDRIQMRAKMEKIRSEKNARIKEILTTGQYENI
ncbi:MAG: hypothetical protein LUD02_13305 [Tannerellaceae bacterium]|nr:hypothetical protein [Tannerellaceae bacterium]